jgi:hypothetical protein
MKRNIITGFVLSTLALTGCGAGGPSEAAQTQMNLAATVAAAATAADQDRTQATTAPSQISAVPTATAVPTGTAPATVAAATVAAPRPNFAATEIAAASAAVPSATAAATSTVVPSATATRPPEPRVTAAATNTAAPSATAIPAPPDDGNPVAISFTDLYSGASITGPILSEKARALNGRKVIMDGYMAPPLMPNVDFFVLTRTPMVYCPFCSTAADWPFDIVFVRMAGGQSIPPSVPSQGIRIMGTFSVGTATDPATGFVSMVRVFADTVEVAQ